MSDYDGLNGQTVTITYSFPDNEEYDGVAQQTIIVNGPATQSIIIDAGESMVIPTGPAGPTGLQGPKGDTGDVGPQGPAGETGPQGPQGDPGPKGDTGSVGPAGPKGDTGDRGPRGYTGATGPQGPQGLRGQTGIQGPKGDRGLTGNTGPRGVQGPEGPVGAQGIQGDKGDTGDTGPTGPAGATGPEGPQGPQGDPGPTGATGPAGETGPTGPPGTTTHSGLTDTDTDGHPASVISYTPGEGVWATDPDPTTVQTALDYLATTGSLSFRDYLSTVYYPKTGGALDGDLTRTGGVLGVDYSSYLGASGDSAYLGVSYPSTSAYAQIVGSDGEVRVEVSDGTNLASLGANSLTLGGVAVVKTNDARLSDARQPSISADVNWNAHDLTNVAHLFINKSIYGLVERFGVNAATTTVNDGNVVISPDATTSIPFVIQGKTSQTANLSEWRNSSNSVLATISPAGVLDALTLKQNGVSFGSAAFTASTAYVAATDGTATRLAVNASAWSTVEKLRVNTPTTADTAANVVLSASTTTAKPLVAQGLASQTANLQEWQDSTGAVKLYVGKTGSFGAMSIGVDAATNSNAFRAYYAQTLLYYALIDAGTGTIELNTNSVDSTWINQAIKAKSGQTGDLTQWRNSSGTTIAYVSAAGLASFAGLSIVDAKNIAVGSTTGTKIGTSNTQKLGLWNAMPIVQPTTAIAAATFVANTSGIVDDSATFDGYTIGQIVKALRNMGALA